MTKSCHHPSPHLYNVVIGIDNGQLSLVDSTWNRKEVRTIRPARHHERGCWNAGEGGVHHGPVSRVRGHSPGRGPGARNPPSRESVSNLPKS